MWVIPLLNGSRNNWITHVLNTPSLIRPNNPHRPLQIITISQRTIETVGGVQCQICPQFNLSGMCPVRTP